jgi:hypothetical protein
VPYGEIKDHVRHGLGRRIRLVSNVVRRDGGEHITHFRRALPLIACGMFSWWLGCCYEVMRRAPALVVRNYRVRWLARRIVACEQRAGKATPGPG